MATGEITGTALTETGDVIENAKVWAVNQETDAVYGPVTTDVNGEYVLDPPGGTYHVFAQAPDGSGGYLNARSSPGVTVESTIPDFFAPQSDELSRFTNTVSDAVIDDTTAIADVTTGLSLRFNYDSNGSNTFVGDTSGINDNVIDDGDTVSCLIRDEGGDDPAVVWYYGGDSDLYAAGIRTSGATANDLVIYEDGYGTSDEVAGNTDISVSTQTWYDLEIAVGSSKSVTVTLYEIDQTTGERQSSLGSAVHDHPDRGTAGNGFFASNNNVNGVAFQNGRFI